MPTNIETNNLKRIKIKGFKSIAKLDLKMNDINILIGANGSGKSNFISFFTLLSHLPQGKLKHYVKTEGGAEHFLHFGSKTTQSITLEVFIDTVQYSATFEPNIYDDAFFVHREFCAEPSKDNHIDCIESKEGESALYKSFSLTEPNSETSKYEKKIKSFIQYYLLKLQPYHFQDTSPHARFKKTNKLINYHYLERDAGNIAPFLYYLKNSDQAEYNNSYNQIITTIKTVAPFFHDFYLEPTGREDDENILLRWTHTEQENPFSANALSDGTARFICLATLLLQPKDLRPATVIIDEPELGLHPAALTVLADIIKSIAKDTQVICSTQSVTFANHFQPEDFIVVDAKDGISTFHRPEKEKLKDWLEDYRMGDIWDKNLIGGRPAW